MRLLATMPVPQLTGTDYRGQSFDLASLRGQPVLLSFYRYASCPICNLRVHSLIQAQPRLAEQGLALVAVFQSPAATIASYVGQQHPPFPLLADPEMTLYRRFGVERGWRGLMAWPVIKAALAAMRQRFWPGVVNGPIDRLPADLLIDSNGLVAIAHYGRHIDDHLPLATIEAWLAETQR